MIAPLDEFGVYVDGFDWLTGQYVARGRRADHRQDLEKKGLLYRARAVHATATRSAGAAAPTSSSGWSTSGSSPWTSCARR